ncbi:MAG: UbiA family prenyltransferase [bacterium]
MIYENRSPQTKTFRAWLELLRPPNLFTIPGDILAGISLASFAIIKTEIIIPVVIISLLLYMSGLILNDYFDRTIDTMERPARPLPSGKISPLSALSAGMIMIIIALFFSFLIGGYIFFITLGIVILIFLYNTILGKRAFFSPIIMGLCRGCNLLLGSAICKNPFTGIVFAGFGIEALYITTISIIAYHETKKAPAGIKRLLPIISPLILLILLLIYKTSIIGVIVMLFTLCWIFAILLHIGQDYRKIPKRIGELIRSLIMIQCAFIALSISINPEYRTYGLVAILFLLCLFPFSQYTANKFYGS